MLWLFGHVAKTAKQLQKTYCPISHELKTTKHWNLVNGENHTGIEAVRLVPDLCLFLIALYEVKASDLQFSYNIFQ